MKLASEQLLICRWDHIILTYLTKVNIDMWNIKCVQLFELFCLFLLEKKWVRLFDFKTDIWELTFENGKLIWWWVSYNMPSLQLDNTWTRCLACAQSKWQKVHLKLWAVQASYLTANWSRIAFCRSLFLCCSFLIHCSSSAGRETTWRDGTYENTYSEPITDNYQMLHTTKGHQT